MFASCEHCQVHLTPGHIVQSVLIPKSANFRAVILKCPMCRENTKIVMEGQKLEDAMETYVNLVDHYEQVLEDAKGEVMDIDGLVYLQEIWSKQPPLREETRGLCKCKSCKEKWYTNA